MTKNKWRIISFVGFIVYTIIFGFCVMKHFEMTAWFVVLPAGILFKFLLDRKKPN